LSLIRVPGGCHRAPVFVLGRKESTVPFAQIYLLEGRTEDQKRVVIEKVTDALCEAVGAPRDNVRVWIHVVPKINWRIATRLAFVPVRP